MRIVITYQHRKANEYIWYIDLAFRSANRFGYCGVNVGDLYILGDKKIEVLPEREPQLMNWVLAAQLAFIESPLFDQPSVLFSPDALILKPLEPVFEQDFDVAFTHRDNPRWPINNGVIFLKPEKKKEIAALWRDALAVCKAYPIETQEWYGDQQSLWDIYQSKRHEIHGLKVSLLPCKNYNASPGDHPGAVDRNLIKEAYVAHFKGKRKNQMETYWNYLCSQKTSN